MLRRMDCPSIPATVQDVVAVPELVDGPLDDLRDELLTRLCEKSAQTYVVSITISLSYLVPLYLWTLWRYTNTVIIIIIISLLHTEQNHLSHVTLPNLCISDL